MAHYRGASLGCKRSPFGISPFGLFVPGPPPASLHTLARSVVTVVSSR